MPGYRPNYPRERAEQAQHEFIRVFQQGDLPAHLTIGVSTSLGFVKAIDPEVAAAVTAAQRALGEDGKPVWQRVMRTKPSPNYDAGDRTGRLPEVIPLDFSSFVKAFNNTATGAAASAARPKPEPTASAAAKPQQ